ncbi:FAD-binding oxidoreductase [Kineococcus gynurae]|uniref:FAD-binding oxidoreductase n=1 Tax=Kineococcus gynurae TaxID=452979 RepID=A0ABV5LPC5_9ACTN
MVDARRRTLLRGGLLALGGLGAAACQGPDAPPAGPSPSATATATPTPGWDDLAGAVADLRRPGSPGYDPAALSYNPRFRARPEGVVTCRSVADVQACVRFVAEGGVAGGAGLRLRNGGHSYGGWSVGEGLVADLSGLDAVRVDAGAGRMRVGAGARLVDVYAAAAGAGVALGAGSCPTIGISGLTLGGGVGVLSRSLGLTCDQVVAADVVTADGRARTVDAEQEPDLFWAVRGGGPGIVAVTGWTFAVRPAPDVTMFYRRWSFDRAADVLAAWQSWIADAPRELWSTTKLLVDADGPRVQVSGSWTGSAPLEQVLAPLLTALPTPTASSARRLGYGAAMAYAAGCSGLDAAACTARALDAEHRLPFAATSSMLGDPLPDAGIDAMVAAVGALGETRPAGAVEAGISVDALGGAVADVAAADSAFPWRTALATVQHTATWTGERDPAPFDAVVTGTREALRPWAGDSAYVNYADATLPDRARACWGPNLERRRRIVARVDPDGVLATPAAP